MPVGGRERQVASDLAQDQYMADIKKAKNEREVRQAEQVYRKRLNAINFGGASRIVSELGGHAGRAGITARKD